MTNTGWKLNRTNINITQEKLNLSKRKFSPTKPTLPAPTTTNNCIGKNHLKDSKSLADALYGRSFSISITLDANMRITHGRPT